MFFEVLEEGICLWEFRSCREEEEGGVWCEYCFCNIWDYIGGFFCFLIKFLFLVFLFFGWGNRSGGNKRSSSVYIFGVGCGDSLVLFYLVMVWFRFWVLFFWVLNNCVLNIWCIICFVCCKCDVFGWSGEIGRLG